jgi:hypothetical protein
MTAVSFSRATDAFGSHPRILRPVPPILAPQDGYLFLDKAKFPASFAADVDAKTAAR